MVCKRREGSRFRALGLRPFLVLFNLQSETTAAVASNLLMYTAAAVRASIAHAIIENFMRVIVVFSALKLYTENPHLFLALVFVLVDFVH